MPEEKNIADVSWHGTEIDKPLWFDPEARILAFTLTGVEDDEADLHIIMNMSDENTSIQLPIISGKKWCIAIDSSLKSPYDIIPPQEQKPFNESSYIVNNKTIVVLENVKC